MRMIHLKWNNLIVFWYNDNIQCKNELYFLMKANIISAGQLVVSMEEI